MNKTPTRNLLAADGASHILLEESHKILQNLYRCAAPHKVPHRSPCRLGTGLDASTRYLPVSSPRKSSDPLHSPEILVSAGG